MVHYITSVMSGDQFSSELLNQIVGRLESMENDQSYLYTFTWYADTSHDLYLHVILVIAAGSE